MNFPNTSKMSDRNIGGLAFSSEGLATLSLPQTSRKRKLFEISPSITESPSKKRRADSSSSRIQPLASGFWNTNASETESSRSPSSTVTATPPLSEPNTQQIRIVAAEPSNNQTGIHLVLQAGDYSFNNNRNIVQLTLPMTASPSDGRPPPTLMATPTLNRSFSCPIIPNMARTVSSCTAPNGMARLPNALQFNGGTANFLIPKPSSAGNVPTRLPPLPRSSSNILPLSSGSTKNLLNPPVRMTNLFDGRLVNVPNPNILDPALLLKLRASGLQLPTPKGEDTKTPELDPSLISVGWQKNGLPPIPASFAPASCQRLHSTKPTRCIVKRTTKRRRRRRRRSGSLSQTSENSSGSGEERKYSESESGSGEDSKVDDSPQPSEPAIFHPLEYFCTGKGFSRGGITNYAFGHNKTYEWNLVKVYGSNTRAVRLKKLFASRLSKGRVEQTFKNTQSNCTAVEVTGPNDELIGGAMVLVDYSHIIELMVVDTRWDRQGFGSFMVHAICCYFAGKRLPLEVSAAEHALPFWLREEFGMCKMDRGEISERERRQDKVGGTHRLRFTGDQKTARAHLERRLNRLHDKLGGV